MSVDGALWDRLARHGLVQGAALPDGHDEGPWYVTAMVGTAAWIAALFLLGFIGALVLSFLNRVDAPLPVGVVLCMASVAVQRWASAGVFLRQVAVAFSLAGQSLIVFGLTEHHLRDPAAWLGVALVEAALVALVPDTVHRVLAALACIVALRIALVTAGVPWLVEPLLLASVLAVFVAGTRLPMRERLWSPLWAALGMFVLALLPLTIFDALFWYGTRAAPSPAFTHVGAVLLGMAWLALVAALVRTSGIRLPVRGTALLAIGTLVVAACAWRIPMVVVALALLLVAFGSGRRVLAGVAVVALLGALAHGYYSLQGSLLAKSGALAATGAVLLLAALATRFAGDEGGNNA